MVEPFPFVDVSGTPYERGRQHGAAVPKRVKRSIELYGGQLGEMFCQSVQPALALGLAVQQRLHLRVVTQLGVQL